MATPQELLWLLRISCVVVFVEVVVVVVGIVVGVGASVVRTLLFLVKVVVVTI